MYSGLYKFEKVRLREDRLRNGDFLRDSCVNGNWYYFYYLYVIVFRLIRYLLKFSFNKI